MCAVDVNCGLLVCCDPFLDDPVIAIDWVWVGGCVVGHENGECGMCVLCALASEPLFCSWLPWPVLGSGAACFCRLSDHWSVVVDHIASRLHLCWGLGVLVVSVTVIVIVTYRCPVPRPDVSSLLAVISWCTVHADTCQAYVHRT